MWFPALASLGRDDSRERSMSHGHYYAPLSPFAAGLACRCPRCGKGALFEGFLGLRPRCESCGLDYSFVDAGDGPAVFVILFAGFVVVGCALAVEVLYQPPFWLHALLWIPLILLVTLGPLRATKGLLIALQYHHKAAEGRLDRSGQP
jgi:uncharacterized protein (DUF983 family)